MTFEAVTGTRRDFLYIATGAAAAVSAIAAVIPGRRWNPTHRLWLLGDPSILISENFNRASRPLCAGARGRYIRHESSARGHRNTSGPEATGEAFRCGLDRTPAAALSELERIHLTWSGILAQSHRFDVCAVGTRRRKVTAIGEGSRGPWSKVDVAFGELFDRTVVWLLGGAR